MKNRFLPLLLPFLLFSANSCRKDLSTSQTDIDIGSELNVKEARSYFYKVLRKTKPNTISDDAGGLGKIYPYWNFAYSSKTKLYSFIEVPITSERRLYVTIKVGENIRSNDQVSSEIVKNSLKRLIIYKDKSGEIKERIITYIPDIDYLKATKYDISHNQIDHLDKRFSGFLEYSDFSGKLLFILKIKNGKAVKKIAPRLKKSKQNTTKGTVCDPIYEEVWLLVCAPSYPDGPAGPEGPEECVGPPTYQGTRFAGWFCYNDGCCGGGEEGEDPCLDPANFNTVECGGDIGPPDPCSGYSYNGSGNHVLDNGCPLNPNLITLSDWENSEIIDDGKDDTVNVQDYFNCFLDGKTALEYKMTIYIDQPVHGQSDQYRITSTNIPNNDPTGIGVAISDVTLDVGHTFVAFEKINTDGTSVTQVIGFYPDPDHRGISTNGVIKDDSGHPYDVSYGVSVGASDFFSALNQAIDDQSKKYVLFEGASLSQSEYNCTDAGINWMHAAGIFSISDVSRGIFKNTPGDLGNALINSNLQVSSVQGNAPQGKGPCN